MAKFETKRPPRNLDLLAPDGLAVRILLGLKRGGMAHFELRPGKTSRAFIHKTGEEIWFFQSGRGEMWRAHTDESHKVDVHPGICLTIPLGTCFQFLCTSEEPLAAIAVAMPPWPGEGEAALVEGPWEATAGDEVEE